MPRFCLPLALGAALLLALGALGTRLGLWDFRTGFLLLRIGAWTGLGVAVVTLVLLLRTHRDGRSLAIAAGALVIGLAVAYIPWRQRRIAFTVPPIHDITTDTKDPPAFVAILPLRAKAMNQATYDGERVAAQQRTAYPDLRPITLEQSPDAAFTQAKAIVDAMHWQLIAAEPAEGRLEAVATTFWFGFKDDVVIRIRPAGTGSVVDLRSKSRLGVSDLGANAARIRDFRRRLIGND